MNATLSLEKKTVITIPTRELKSKFKKMLPFMGKNHTRYYLCGIYCHYSLGKLTFCATNGYILCEIVQELKSFEGGEFSLILSAEAVKHLIKVMPTTDDCPFIMIKVSNDSKEIEFQSYNFSYTTKALDGIFPDYHKVIPNGKIKIREGMRANYLMAILKALGDTPVDMSVDDGENASSAPHLLTSRESEGIRCVIMPSSV